VKGDYVIADRAQFDTFDGQTFKITGFTRNLLGLPLVRVADIATDRPTVFYPHELSWEDGTRPTD
ncbi:hypothetical protein, partial [Streptomyces sp. NPDC059468]|uniref:hypothetical protein n=1 Tax=Streptomyces sp. NPDC059468 TaxID=3346845 RepID=UPI0036ABDC24